MLLRGYEVSAPRGWGPTAVAVSFIRHAHLATVLFASFVFLCCLFLSSHCGPRIFYSVGASLLTRPRECPVALNPLPVVSFSLSVLCAPVYLRPDACRVTHLLTELDYADYVYVMRQGQISGHGPPADVGPYLTATGLVR